MSLLSIKKLSVNYGTNPALKNINLELEKGELICVIGPNGSGKSTLFKSILNLVDYTGDIFFNSTNSKQLLNKIGYMPQTDSIDVNFPITVEEVIEQSQIGKVTNKKAIQDAIEITNIHNLSNKNINELSGGQLQRVFLARALAQDSELLLLDEPFSNMDAITQTSIVEVLKELVKNNKTVVITTHNLKLAQEISSKVILLNKKVICYGKPKEVSSKDHLMATFGENIVLTTETGDITLSDHHHH